MAADRASSTTPSTKTDQQGLELAEHRFGPLLHPTPATKSAWTNYSISRFETNQQYCTIFPGSGKDSENGSEDSTVEDSEEDEDDEDDPESEEAWFPDSISSCVFQIEKEMNLEVGTLQKCITILCDRTELDDEEVRTAC